MITVPGLFFVVVERCMPWSKQDCGLGTINGERKVDTYIIRVNENAVDGRMKRGKKRDGEGDGDERARTSIRKRRKTKLTGRMIDRWTGGRTSEGGTKYSELYRTHEREDPPCIRVNSQKKVDATRDEGRYT